MAVAPCRALTGSNCRSKAVVNTQSFNSCFKTIVLLVFCDSCWNLCSTTFYELRVPWDTECPKRIRTSQKICIDLHWGLGGGNVVGRILRSHWGCISRWGSNNAIYQLRWGMLELSTLAYLPTAGNRRLNVWIVKISLRTVIHFYFVELWVEILVWFIES